MREEEKAPSTIWTYYSRVLILCGCHVTTRCLSHLSMLNLRVKVTSRPRGARLGYTPDASEEFNMKLKKVTVSGPEEWCRCTWTADRYLSQVSESSISNTWSHVVFVEWTHTLRSRWRKLVRHRHYLLRRRAPLKENRSPLEYYPEYPAGVTGWKIASKLGIKGVARSEYVMHHECFCRISLLVNAYV